MNAWLSLCELLNKPILIQIEYSSILSGKCISLKTKVQKCDQKEILLDPTFFQRKFLCNLFFKGCKRLSCVVEILSFSHWADSYQYIRSNFPPTLSLQNYPLEIIEHVLQTVGVSLERCLFILLCNSNIQVQKWIFQKNLENYVEHNRELNFYLHSLCLPSVDWI